jgi:hypothetical protein
MKDIKIYVASRASIPERGIMWRDLRSRGANIVSSWINEQEETSLESLWTNITEEIKSCDRIVMYVEQDDFPLKGTLIEAGMALALGKPVYIVAPNLVLEETTFRPLGSWANHPLVKFIDKLESAIFDSNPVSKHNPYDTVYVTNLSGMELDYWVATSLGHTVLGKALAYYDPESGYPAVEKNQTERTGCLATHERYFYVDNCDCVLCEELYQEMKQRRPDLKPENKILGHDWRCLQPVLNYSTDLSYVGEFLSQGNINFSPHIEGFIATSGIFALKGKTVSEAVMRAFVTSKLGKIVNK